MPYTHRLLIALTLCLIITAPALAQSASFGILNDKQQGTITVSDDDQPVFRFNYKPTLPDGVPDEYRRAGFIHPLYDLDGQPLTEAFPQDHYHQRGLWLSWPNMTYHDRDVQLWHPSPLRNRFDYWRGIVRDSRALLVIRNNWTLDDQTIGREHWRILTHPQQNNTRAIDITLTIAATEDPIHITGEQGMKKGYGGLALRASPSLAQGTILTSNGPLSEDAVHETFAWADLATDNRGIALFPHPSNPNSPPPWLLRTSYGGILNPQWPGLKHITLTPGNPVTLRYRILIHRNRLTQSQLQQAFENWTTPAQQQTSQ